MRIRMVIPLMMLVVVSSCGGGSKHAGLADGASGDMETYESGAVNAVVQAKPDIMVLPSDRNLRSFGCISSRTIDGERYQIRDYKKYLLHDMDFRPIVANIQDRFNSANYPLNDFEQTLKSIDNINAMDIADNLSRDAKTRLLSVAVPDIVLELDYDISADYTKSSRSEKEARYVLNAVDAYTNKVVATIQGDGMTGDNGVTLLTKDMNRKLPDLMDDIQKYFDDILTRGREITVRVNVASDSNQRLNDSSIEGDTYADEIMDYIKSHTIKGAYKLQSNTADQITFSNVRIKVLNKDGTQYGVYDWTREFQKYLKKNLGLSTENRSQGLGEVILTIKGIEES